MMFVRLATLLTSFVFLAACGSGQKPVALEFHVDEKADATVTIVDRLDGDVIRSYTLSRGDEEHERLLGWIGANQSHWFSFPGEQAFVQARVSVGSVEFSLVANAAVVKFRGKQYRKPVETLWLIEMLTSAGT